MILNNRKLFNALINLNNPLKQMVLKLSYCSLKLNQSSLLAIGNIFWIIATAWNRIKSQFAAAELVCCRRPRRTNDVWVAVTLVCKWKIGPGILASLVTCCEWTEDENWVNPFTTRVSYGVKFYVWVCRRNPTICDHPNKNYLAVLLYGTICFVFLFFSSFLQKEIWDFSLTQLFCHSWALKG